MTTRNDIHRESAIQPEQYTEVLYFAYSGSDPFFDPAINLDRLRELRATVKFFRGGTGGCDICGARFRFGSVFRHDPTGEHILVGHICSDKMSFAGDREAWAALRGEAHATSLARHARQERFENLRAAIENDPSLRRLLGTDHPIARDMRAKFIRHPTLSDAQRALLEKLANEAETEPEVMVPAPAAAGRVVIEGLVISAKEHDGMYGRSLKITIKVAAEGGSWLAWGTCPQSLIDGVQEHTDGRCRAGVKGCTVRMAATLQPGREPHFALFKRPSKAEVLARPLDLARVAEMAEWQARAAQAAAAAEAARATA